MSKQQLIESHTEDFEHTEMRHWYIEFDGDANELIITRIAIAKDKKYRIKIYHNGILKHNEDYRKCQ